MRTSYRPVYFSIVEKKRETEMSSGAFSCPALQTREKETRRGQVVGLQLMYFLERFGAL